MYATESVRKGLLDRLKKSKARSPDAWQEGTSPRHPTQFLSLEPMDKVMR